MRLDSVSFVPLAVQTSFGTAGFCGRISRLPTAICSSDIDFDAN